MSYAHNIFLKPPNVTPGIAIVPNIPTSTVNISHISGTPEQPVDNNNFAELPAIQQKNEG